MIRRSDKAAVTIGKAAEAPPSPRLRRTGGRSPRRFAPSDAGLVQRMIGALNPLWKRIRP